MSGKRRKREPLFKRFRLRLGKSGGTHKVLAAVTAMIGLVMMSFAFVSAPAQATGGGSNDNFKVFVCKYVGTPGVDERLQTGDNPISVSVNSIPDYQGVGSYFADQHGRSFVLAVDDTPPGPAGDPDVSACPPPDNPPDVIQVPAEPGVTDPCGPNNASWNVPADTDTLNWELLGNGHLTVTVIPENTTFPGGSTSHDYGVPTDSGEPCPPNVIDVPAEPGVTDPCGPNNASWNVPADTDTLNWELLGNGHLTVTVIPENTTFPGGATSHDFGKASDSGVMCPEEDKVSICHATSAVANPYVTLSVPVSSVDGIAGNSGGQPDHYGEHQGPIFDPAIHENGDEWGDIIPPVPPHHTGLNWTAEGQAVYNNGCELPEEPPTEVPVPTQETVDPCNPQGVTNNVAWKDPLPADTGTTDWSESNNGATRTATLIGNAEWSDGTTEPKVFNLPADSGLNCPPPEECPDGNQDEDETKPCYVEREPDVRVESGTREGCKLHGEGGVETTTAVYTTTYSFNEETQAWESSETATSSVTFTPYTAAELKEKGCVKSPPPDDHTDTPDNPTFDTGLSGQSPEPGQYRLPVGLIGLLLLGLSAGMMLIGSPTLARVRRR